MLQTVTTFYPNGKDAHRFPAFLEKDPQESLLLYFFRCCREYRR